MPSLNVDGAGSMCTAPCHLFSILLCNLSCYVMSLLCHLLLLLQLAAFWFDKDFKLERKREQQKPHTSLSFLSLWCVLYMRVQMFVVWGDLKLMSCVFLIPPHFTYQGRVSGERRSSPIPASVACPLGVPPSPPPRQEWQAVTAETQLSAWRD